MRHGLMGASTLSRAKARSRGRLKRIKPIDFGRVHSILIGVNFTLFFLSSLAAREPKHPILGHPRVKGHEAPSPVQASPPQPSLLRPAKAQMIARTPFRATFYKRHAREFAHMPVDEDLVRRATAPTALLYGRAGETPALRSALAEALAGSAGRRALLVTTVGGHDRHAGYITFVLRSAGIDAVPFTVPDVRFPVAAVEEACALASRVGCGSVVGVGGGAVLDIAKLVAASMTNVRPRGGPRMSDFALEMRGLQGAANFDRAPLPFVAAPTCVGVGAETSASARVSDGEDWLTFCDDALSPTAALFDPTLTESAPSDLSAAQGVAALAQCAEAALFPDDDAAGSGWRPFPSSPTIRQARQQIT